MVDGGARERPRARGGLQPSAARRCAVGEALHRDRGHRPDLPRRGRRGSGAPASPGLNSWFTSQTMAGGGALIDLGPHVLDSRAVPAGRAARGRGRARSRTVSSAGPATARWTAARRWPATASVRGRRPRERAAATRRRLEHRPRDQLGRPHHRRRGHLDRAARCGRRHPPVRAALSRRRHAARLPRHRRHARRRSRPTCTCPAASTRS